MVWAKRGLHAFLLTLVLLASSLVAATPASAAVTQTHCHRNVCLQIVRNSSSGRTVTRAYVYMPGALQGTVVRVMYVGYSAAGTLKGPQRSEYITCNPTCAQR
jgi:hypothetical protein